MILPGSRSEGLSVLFLGTLCMLFSGLWLSFPVFLGSLL